MQPIRLVSPTSWTPGGGIVIPAGAGYSTGVPAVQVGGQRRGRQTIVVSNIGGGGAVLLNAQNANVAQGVTLGINGLWSIDTEGEVWVASTAGTTVDVLETWWPQIAENGDVIALPNLRGGFG